MSLLFNEEDPSKFKKRVEECKERQYIAEDQLRLFKHVDALDDIFVSSLSKEVCDILKIMI